MRKFFSFTLPFAIVLTAITCFADEKEYMLVTIDGQKCGYAVNQRVETKGQVETSEMVKMTVNRLGFTMEVTEKTTYLETADGKPLSFVTEQKFSDAPEQVTKGRINNGKVKLMRTGEGQSVVDFKTGALMPEGVRLLLLNEGIEPGKRYEILIFDAALIQSLPAKIEVFEKEKIDLLGRVKELYKVITTTTIPGAGDVRLTSYVDEGFKTYKSSTWLMGMTIEMIACEQEVATSPNAPADLFSNLLLTSPVTIPEAKLKEPITYILKIKPEAKDVQIPSGDMQEVTLEGDKITVRVTPASDDKGEPLDKGNEDKAMSEYLSANGYMQSNDPEIEKLAQKALGDAKDTLTAAHNVESFVHEYITQKNLSAGYSTAKEVMTSREGDCTEHAILTAALCRAAGIPARMACGVVYAEQFAGKGDIFGGHAWTECFVGGKWIGLDATMGENGYGSGHIKLAEGNGRPEDFFSLINMLGNFEIVDIKF